MANMQWGNRFAPAEATRGQFIPISIPSLTADGVPFSDLSGSRGKYAVLTHIVGNTGMLSAQVTNPVSLQGIISCDLVEVDNIWFSNPISSNVVQSIPISAIVIGTVPVRIGNQTLSVSTAEPNTTYTFSSSVSTGALHQVTFPQVTKSIEVVNYGFTANTNIATTFVLLSGGTAPTGPTNNGMVVTGRSNSPGYYTIDYNTTNLFYEVADNSTRVRIFAHY